MKAIILAGGEGTRLRSVSGALPKPMVPLLGRPILEHIIILLKNCGFEDICIAVRYRAEQICDYFKDGRAHGVRIVYSHETEPLGTAGAVKGCRNFYGKDDFLVISGDAVCDMELDRLFEKHISSGAAASVALYKEKNPNRFGLALTDGEGIIHSFIEKPDWPRVVTDSVNTGIYVLSPAAMEYVPDGVPFDFGKDLFPLLLKRREKLMGFDMDGYWCDVGTPLSYYKCCIDALEGRLKISPADGFSFTQDESAEDTPSDGIDCPCENRAAVMAVLSDAVMELGADYSDGIRLETPYFFLHIAPRESISAIHVSARAEDAEFAEELMLTAKELIEKLEL